MGSLAIMRSFGYPVVFDASHSVQLPGGLGKASGAERLEAACARALRLGACSYRAVKNILASSLDRVPLDESPSSPLPAHDNIRGALYYQGD